MHARAVTSLFKAAQATLTANSASQVDITTIRSKLGLDRLIPQEKAPRVANGLHSVPNYHSIPEIPSPPPDSSYFPSETRIPRPSGYQPPPRQTSIRATPSVAPTIPVKSLDRRFSNLAEKKDSPLPPPPSDDIDDYEIVNTPPTLGNLGSVRPRGPSLSNSVDNYSTHSSEQNSYSRARPRGISETSWGRETPSDHDYLSSSPPSLLFRTEAQEQAARSRAKWAAEEGRSQPSRPKRGRTKSDIQREREKEEQEMARAAAEAAARRKFEKEKQLLLEAEEEERNKVCPIIYVRLSFINP